MPEATTTPAAGDTPPPAATPPETPPAATSPEAKLTQADVDRIVQERLARDRKDRPSDEELAALKEAKQKLDELETANATELEKAVKRAEKAEADSATVTSTAHKALRKAAVISAAAGAKVDPELAHALLSERGFKVSKGDKEIEVTVGDDGEVTGAKDAIAALVALKPSIQSDPDAPPSGDGGPRTTPAPKDLDAQIKEAEAKGDHKLSMSLKNQKLIAMSQQQAQ